MTLCLKRARADDLPAITSLVSNSGLPSEDLQHHIDGFVVALMGDEIVGTAGLEVHGSQGLLRSVCVEPAMRAHGLGAQLVSWVLQEARNRRLGEVYLLTTTAESYFASKGFTRIDRTEVTGPVLSSQEFASICPLSAAVMVMRLN